MIASQIMFGVIHELYSVQYAGSHDWQPVIALIMMKPNKAPTKNPSNAVRICFILFTLNSGATIVAPC